MEDSDLLTRFLYRSKEFNKNGVHFTAFMPNKGDLGISVFDITEITDGDVWDIEAQKDREKKARADISVSAVESVGNLKVYMDEPPERHANIMGYPAEIINQRPRAKNLARDLAAKATLKLAP